MRMIGLVDCEKRTVNEMLTKCTKKFLKSELKICPENATNRLEINTEKVALTLWHD